jgi:hypothetical protein
MNIFTDPINKTAFYLGKKNKNNNYQFKIYGVYVFIQSIKIQWSFIEIFVVER